MLEKIMNLLKKGEEYKIGTDSKEVWSLAEENKYSFKILNDKGGFVETIVSEDIARCWIENELG